MGVDARAGRVADPSTLENIPRLVTSYFARRPNMAEPGQRVAFGTSGHRGSSLDRAFNEEHILAITQAICLHRRQTGVDGPLFLGIDTHALSECAMASALEVLVANGVEVMLDDREGYTPTPVISHAILTYNRGRRNGMADGIVVTPSHNPPRDGGFKYNPPHGGGAESSVTAWIQGRANDLLDGGLHGVSRVPFERARIAPNVHRHNYMDAYIEDLANVIDFDPLRGAGLRLGVDPLGGAGVCYWEPIAERYGLSLTLLSKDVDPTFRFVTVDWDGKIRMDPSSPYAMQRLIAAKGQFDVSWGCDTDHDRHGVVTRSEGLLNTNSYLAVAIAYLFKHRPQWPAIAGIGKTVVSSSLIDRVAAKLGRPLVEVPVGFKWFVDGLFGGTLAFAGEESAGASFVRRDGTVWTTDKDGILLGLLSAEMTAVMGLDPGELRAELVREIGDLTYERTDAPATPAQKAALARLSARDVTITELAGDPITEVLTHAPGNHAPIGGLKVVTARGWFAARPSGTEDIYKLYAESSSGPDHLRQIQEEGRAIVAAALNSAGRGGQ
jgi:phosphoglucomutase